MFNKSSLLWAVFAEYDSNGHVISTHTGDTPSLSFVHKHWHVSLPILASLSAVHVEASHQTFALIHALQQKINESLSFPFTAEAAVF